MVSYYVYITSLQIDIDDNTKLSAADYRERLYEEIQIRRKESRRKHKDILIKRGTFSNAISVPIDDTVE